MPRLELRAEREPGETEVAEGGWGWVLLFSPILCQKAVHCSTWLLILAQKKCDAIYSQPRLCSEVK